ncbi:MAG: hypothetical protein QW728_04010, partial [Thermoplasmata archaeon]
MSIDELKREFYLIGIREGWHLCEAKFKRHQSLLSHALNVAGITEHLLKLFGITDEKRCKLAVGLAFIHDAAKEDPYRPGLMQKTYSEARIKELLKELGFQTNEIDSLHAMYLHGSLESPAHVGLILQKGGISKDPMIERIVHDLADPLESINDFSEVRKIEQNFQKKGEDISLTYHQVSPIRGILTTFLHKALQEIYEADGWLPIIYRPYGTIYISKGKKSPPDIRYEQLVNKLKDTGAKFFENLAKERELGRNAVGKPTASPITKPEMYFLNDSTIEQFWEEVVRKQGRNRNDEVSLQVVKELWPNLDEEIAKARMTQILDIYNITIYLWGTVKIIAELSLQLNPQKGNDWRETDVYKKFLELYNTKVFGLCSTANGIKISTGLNKEYTELKKIPSWRKISDKSKTIPEDFPTVFAELNNNIGKQHRKIAFGLHIRTLWDWSKDGKEINKELGKNYAEITKELSKTFPVPRLDFQSLTEKLIGDVSFPMVVRNPTISGVVNSYYSHYYEGKVRGASNCAVCGGVPEIDAISDNLGAGQVFTNFLSASSKLGKGNKLQLCKLCDFETKIRSVLLPKADPKNLKDYYVIPQVNFSSGNRQIWMERIHQYIHGMSEYGVFPVTADKAWSKNLYSGLTSLVEPKVIDSVISSYSKAKDNKKRIVKEFIEELISDGVTSTGMDEDEILKDVLNLPAVIPKKQVIEEILAGKSLLPPDLEKVLKNRLMENGRALMFYETPNYLLIVFEEVNEDSKQVTELLDLFRASLLSRIFSASVVVKSEPFMPYIWTFPQGAVYLATHVNTLKLLENMNLKLQNGWLEFKDLDRAIIKMASIYELKARAYKDKKNNIIDILKNQPGRTLENVMMSEGDSKHVLHLLEAIFEDDGGKTLQQILKQDNEWLKRMKYCK